MSWKDDPYADDAPDETQEDIFAHETFWEETPVVMPGVFPDQPLPDEDEDEEDELPPHTIFKPAVKQPNFILCVLVNVVRILSVLVLVAGLALVGAVAGIAKGYMETAPTLDLAALDEQAQTSFIYDANGNLITEYKGIENRVMVSIQAMPVYLQHAFVAVEDARFYTHPGVDLKRIAGAFISNLSSTTTQGGSTITQQLIKNTLLSSEQSYKRKIQEAYLAMQLETQYSKDEILECYLNTIWLGENYYGVQTAAEGYFGKPLRDLTLRECAILAGTCNSPYYYNPRRNFYTRSKEGVDYVAITNDRTDYVLRCMYENQFITWEQYQEALNPATAHVLESDPNTGTGMYEYPHYVEYAVTEVVDILLELNHLEDTSANRYAMENKLRTGGYRVVLAIDTSIQTTVENTLASWTKYPSLRDPSDRVYRARNSDGTYDEIIQPQAAAVVLDYHTGEIKAIVGSRTVPTAKKTLNRAVDMNMPVGSAIKPISVYAPAIENGASPASVVSNMPLPIPGWKNERGVDDWPRNYGGSYYAGPQTLRQALVNSHNTASAQTLLTMVGVNRSVDFLQKMGVDNSHIDATPFGLALGSSGLTPLEMSAAFGVLANGGVYQEPISVLGISDSQGNVIWDGRASQARYRVFQESTAWCVVDMLKDAVTSGTGTSARISGQTVAGKTGTNSDQRGVCFTGMTGYYVSSLWVGHDNYKPLSSKTTGSSAAAPLWQSYMKKIHEGKPNADILRSDYRQYGLTRVETCSVSGLLATDACRRDSLGYGTVTDYWVTPPTERCNMHQTLQICQDSGMLATDYCWSVAEEGVIVIPSSHALSRFIGTQYENVLVEYLGGYCLYGQSGYCTQHNAYSSGGNSGAASDSGIISSALLLMGQAQTRLASMDPYSAEYQQLSMAIDNLQWTISQPGMSTNDIVNAMSIVSQAMQ